MPNLNTLLDRCVLLVYEFFDRFFLNGYVARLQDADDLAWFLTKVRGHDIPRYEVLGEMSRRFVAAVGKLAADQQIPLIEFERGQRKEDIAAPLFEKARLADREGVVLIGWAQERVNVFSPPNKQDRQSGKFAPKRHPARPKTFYFYIWDRDWGPTNIRICTYAPFAMRINLNGQMWLIQHLRRSGHYVETIDNGIADVDDKEALRRLCRRFLGRDFNRRLLQLERQSHRAAPSATQIQALVMPSGPASHRVPGLRLGAPRVAALLAALCRFQLIFGGFRRHQLQQLVHEHLGADYSGGQAAYDLARLKGKGLIVRLPHTHRYQLTDLGMRMATLFTTVHSQVLCAGLTQLDPHHPPTLVSRAYRAFQEAVRQHLVGTRMAA